MGSAIAAAPNAPAAAPKDALEAVASESGLILNNQTFMLTNDHIIDICTGRSP